ncbi:hypothetical protein [Nocardiopsis sp. JB363]|uniref:hypothetical protein n=1 Tax=Nocardiopsis sp. JB363 TaxID=1434837 RepID=UPI000B35DA56|nr:hypothetical protein [Nocardiopsis sp. JB363]
MSRITPLGLWVDWCAVTGTSLEDRDPVTLDRFARQASPSQRVLAALRPMRVLDGPAWPAEHRGDTGSLHRLLARGTVLGDHPDVAWLSRLRLRRLLFAGVLLAPASHGGLGLSRPQSQALTPDRLQRLRPTIAHTEGANDCPACAVWSWIEVIGANYDWSRSLMRNVIRRRSGHKTAHQHEQPDPYPDWRMSPVILAGIDRWGWIEPWTPMHPASISRLVRAIRALLDGPAPQPAPAVAYTSAPPPRQIDPEEEAEIHARADEILARVEDALAEFG